MAGKGLYYPPVHFHKKMTQWRMMTAENQRAEHEKEGVRAELLNFFKDPANKAKKGSTSSGSGGVGGGTRAAATPRAATPARGTKRGRGIFTDEGPINGDIVSPDPNATTVFTLGFKRQSRVSSTSTSQPSTSSTTTTTTNKANKNKARLVDQYMRDLQNLPIEASALLSEVRGNKNVSIITIVRIEKEKTSEKDKFIVFSDNNEILEAAKIIGQLGEAMIAIEENGENEVGVEVQDCCGLKNNWKRERKAVNSVRAMNDEYEKEKELRTVSMSPSSRSKK